MADSSFISSSEMRWFFTKLLIFAILFLILDFIVGEIFEPFYYKVKRGTIYNTIYSIRDSHENIVILGASEVKHSFISRQIEDSLGLTCYNLGLDGNNIYYQYSIFRELLERYVPEIVVISTSVVAENENTVATLLPLQKKYKKIREIILDVAPMERYKMISNAYIYNSLALNILQGLSTTEMYANGYVPLYSEYNYIGRETRSFSINSTPRTLRYFDSFLNLAISAGCEIIVVNTPRCWYNSLHSEHTSIEEIIDKYNVALFDYEIDPTFLYKNNLFYDGVHLNHRGAEIFTNKFIGDLKKYLYN